MVRYQANKKLELKKFRKKKPVVKTRGFWFVVFGVICAGGLAYFLLFSGFLSIKEIEINDVEGISKDDLTNLAKGELSSQVSFFNRNNILFSSVKNIEDKILSAYSVLESVTIKRQLPNALIIEAIKREPKLLWCYQDGAKCFLVDKNCLVFQEVWIGDWQNKILPVFVPGEPRNILDRVCSESEISQILKIQDTLNGHDIMIEKASKDEQGILLVSTVEGWRIYFDFSSDIDLCLVKLKLLLEKELIKGNRTNLEYIDLRFFKVYYK